ncbi:MAG TPA: cell envelope integrity protein TolA [Candidatus Binataceae bacterium]|nr:cell envelope integrity protein TolA [Candidatus Binataceae bacterium]
MASPNDRGNTGRPSWRGYTLAMVVSALGHAALIVLMLVIIPRIWRAPQPPAAYTVKIVDSMPAGDLGTHLPRLSESEKPAPAARASQAPEAAATPPPEDRDKEAIALNTIHVTPTPTPRATPSPRPTSRPTPRATIAPTPRPRKAHPITVAPTPTTTPTPRRARRRRPAPPPTPSPVVVAKAAPTPSVRQQLAKVRAQLLAEESRRPKASREETTPKGIDAAERGGPVVANRAWEGKGYGVGPGSGSAGIQQDAGFLLYYQEVQKRIKDAWSFAGGSDPDLTATVTFGINPDGSLNSVKVTSSSHDPAFDDSVVRAIRRAAPFAPPPDKYQAQFLDGVPAIFKLANLTNAGN